VELCQGPDFNEPAPELTTALIDGLRDAGILIGAAGDCANVLKIRPPLCITKAHANDLIAAIDVCLAGQAQRSGGIVS
jgi:4-aminobutyrate aminotransferase-like enzyme